MKERENLLFPDYIFESSWEVCNKVGGIYTVLSTRAKTLHDVIGDNLFFIGPDLWKDKTNSYFVEDKSLYKEWREKVLNEGLNLRLGRWNIPGQPIVILVDFLSFFDVKDQIYGWFWKNYKVDSLHAYGDYDESSMFSYAAGKIVESFYRNNIKQTAKVIYQAHEWMTGFGLLYINNAVPEIATIFTTHATSIGRSIAGNNKPLYDYLFAYNGDQMAEELNMQSKHSIEKQSAMYTDCFTTVSRITGNECKELLDKEPDVLLPNGFDNSFVPKPSLFSKKRKLARERLIKVANALLGANLDDDVLIVSTSGRYEFKNKGIDVYIESLNRLLRDRNLKKTVLAFVEVPGWVGDPREDLLERLKSNDNFMTPLDCPFITHWLHEMNRDNILNMLKYNDMHNRSEDKVKVVFMPCYLDGKDGILDLNYYDTILANDLCIYPSYYEPWGYTPLESIAFSVPCITTDLAGFGLWVQEIKGGNNEIIDGVKVIHRTDYNYSEVADVIKDTVTDFSNFNKVKIHLARKNAEELSEKALWNHFIKYYYKAYDFALNKAMNRVKKKNI
jgi:glycosyltransferase involved in cell wall biosynthesis